MTCTPPRALSPPLSCNTGTANGALCAAIVTIVEAATCDELASQPYVQSLIEKVGLAGDVRGARIYGDDKRLMRHVGSHTGLWQDPRQISRAMMALGSLPPQPAKEAPFRYVEVGVFTAWTCCIVSAFLSRVAAGNRGFQGFAVDIKTGNIAAPTLKLFKTLNITFVGRSAFNKQLLAQSADESGPRYDACFIDGDHGYRAVRSDYQQLAPHCRSAMFHDIQDTSTMIADSYSGGVRGHMHMHTPMCTRMFMHSICLHVCAHMHMYTSTLGRAHQPPCTATRHVHAHPHAHMHILIPTRPHAHTHIPTRPPMHILIDPHTPPCTYSSAHAPMHILIPTRPPMHMPMLHTHTQVPMFWAYARSHVRRNRVVELTMQGSPYWPVFGIGTYAYTCVHTCKAHRTGPSLA